MHCIFLCCCPFTHHETTSSYGISVNRNPVLPIIHAQGCGIILDPTSNITVNIVEFAFSIYPQSDYFLTILAASIMTSATTVSKSGLFAVASDVVSQLPPLCSLFFSSAGHDIPPPF